MLGNSKSNYFDLNLSLETQKEIVNQLYKMKWDKKHHNQEKHYYFEDMKYIINKRNMHFCSKTKVLSYDIQDNALMGQYSNLRLPIDKFPPINEYHNMIIVESTSFVRNSLEVHVRTVSHHNNETSYEVRIESRNKDEAIQFSKELGYDINEFKPKHIEHGNYYIMSII